MIETLMECNIHHTRAQRHFKSNKKSLSTTTKRLLLNDLYLYVTKKVTLTSNDHFLKILCIYLFEKDREYEWEEKQRERDKQTWS